MNDDYTHIAIVLDRSGSMAAVQDETITAYNDFLKEQKEQGGKATLTLTQFNHEYDLTQELAPIEDTDELNFATYVPRGYTALLDAIGRTITSVGDNLADMNEAERPANVLFVVLTDGKENSSEEYDLEAVKNMIQRQREDYDWQFMFLGAGEDALQDAKNLGMSTDMAAQYSRDKMDATMSTVSSKAAAYRTTGDSSSLEYDPDEREQIS